MTRVAFSQPAAAGPIHVKGRITGPAGTLTDAVRLDSGLARPLVFRRGPSAAGTPQPAAGFQFNRTERARLEIPLPDDAKPGAGRLLDRAAQPLAVPVAVAERIDDTGQRWLTADIMLAPLGIGEYAIEVGMIRPGGEQRIVTAIRVTR